MYMIQLELAENRQNIRDSKTKIVNRHLGKISQKNRQNDEKSSRLTARVFIPGIPGTYFPGNFTIFYFPIPGILGRDSRELNTTKNSTMYVFKHFLQHENK